MATTLIAVNCKLVQMMPYVSILKVRKFHQPTASRFITARKKPVGGHKKGLRDNIRRHLSSSEIRLFDK